MIRLFIGTPGAGKSYAALKDVVEELVYGSRLVVTNLPILVEELNPWLAANYPLWGDDINQRVRLITEEQTKQFYRYRSMTGDLGKVSKQDSLEGRHLPYGEHRGNGVLYVIDEAHIPFDSREWASTGPELTYYNSQHRKLGDELVFITQFEKLIDVRVRGFVQDFCYFNNNGMERFLTLFQKPQNFTMEVHRKPPGQGAPPPLEKRIYRMDFTLAKCYDTSAGVGIVGRKMPERKRKKGFAVWWLILPIVLAGIILSQVPKWLGKGAGMFLHGTREGLSEAGTQLKGMTETKKQVDSQKSNVPRGTMQEPVIVPSVELPRVRGLMRVPGRGVVVLLSDGSRKSTVPEVFESVTIHGVKYEMEKMQKDQRNVSTLPETAPITVSDESKQPKQPIGDSKKRDS